MRKFIFVILSMVIMSTLSACSRDNEPAMNQLPATSITQESDAIDPPKREMIGSYQSLGVDAKGPEFIYKVIDPVNCSPDRMVETISKVMPNMIAVRSESSNSIVLRGEREEISKAEKLIRSLDKKVPQILIEGRVVEVSQNGLSDLGIIWGREQGSFKFSVDKNTGGISQSDNIIASLNMLVAEGKAKILANPRIVALDGKEAEINIGSRVPYAVPAGSSSSSNQWTIQYIDAGVNLRILPNVASDGSIVTTIKPEVSNISEWRTTSAGEFPVISTRNAQVTVRLKDGESLAIGGLINESDRDNRSALPFLSDIPFIGRVFQRNVAEKTRTDVVFLITPHLIP